MKNYSTGTECDHMEFCDRTERKSTLVISLVCHVLSKHFALLPSLALPYQSHVIVCACCATIPTPIMPIQSSMLMHCIRPAQCILLRYYAHCLVLAFSGKTCRDTCRIAHSRGHVKMLYTTYSHYCISLEKLWRLYYHLKGLHLCSLRHFMRSLTSP